MTSYRDAGIDIEAADGLVRSIASDVVATWTERVVGPFGGFAAGVELPDRYKSPVIMMSTDGVGTKLELARRSGLWSGVGQDLVAMCVDDLAAAGATPIGFVDYLAVGALHPPRDRAIVASVAAACTQARCPLLGGETAEHPGVMAPDAIDLAGTAMGVVEKGEEIGPHLVGEGDLLVGLRSPNLRSNGFSLVRAVFGDEIDQHIETLLAPSVIYSPTVIEAIGRGGVHSAAHITGGGLAANVGRALPEGLGAVIDSSAWKRPEIFDLVAERGIEEPEMFRTFNMGIGFCIVADPDRVDDLAAVLDQHDPAVLGKVETRKGVEVR
ncbi:MAG: phosphoribosylformylglycinamidine cyclo-ligase [Acidimicrobiia bacterium]|nr:phosphoribosylformylglycinamidine cyclo-ligase [Acidimicrobiia bacterium]